MYFRSVMSYNGVRWLSRIVIMAEIHELAGQLLNWKIMNFEL